MKSDELEKILIEGFLHTPETRTDFYLNKAIELGYSPISFFNGLKSAYDRINKYVNSYDYHGSWITKNPDGTGEREYFKNEINTLHLGYEFYINITHENILELSPALYSMGQKILAYYKGNKTDSSIPNNFIPQHIEKLNEWILPDYINKFTEIEKALFVRGYIDNSYKWQKKKTDLTEFLCVIIEYKYFKPKVNGKGIQDFHKRQFISERYGLGKTGLSETWKKANKNIELAKIPFSWIEKPQ